MTRWEKRGLYTLLLGMFGFFQSSASPTEHWFALGIMALGYIVFVFAGEHRK